MHKIGKLRFCFRAGSRCGDFFAREGSTATFSLGRPARRFFCAEGPSPYPTPSGPVPTTRTLQLLKFVGYGALPYPTKIKYPTLCKGLDNETRRGSSHPPEILLPFKCLRWSATGPNSMDPGGSPPRRLCISAGGFCISASDGKSLLSVTGD